MTRIDAAVVGSGPNGLAAAITLARAGLEVRVFEAVGTSGGRVRSDQLTLPGFQHDVCSAVHPLALASPFFLTLPLSQRGLEWIHPALPLAHPLDDAPPVLLDRRVEATAAAAVLSGLRTPTRPDRFMRDRGERRRGVERVQRTEL